MAGNPKKRSIKDIASEIISQSEGNESEVYKDTKKKPTVGRGLNLKAPETRFLFQQENYNPDDVISGKVKVPEEVLNRIHDRLVDINLERVQKQFGDLGLSDNQMAALTSLRYNSPALIGPNLENALMSGNKDEAAKEILLRSNKDKNLGIAKRRLHEASLFSDGKIPDISPEETMDLRHTFETMPDTAERRKLFTDYPIINPEQVKTGYPFFKIKRNLYSPMKEEFEASKSPLEASFEPIQNLNTQYIAPMDTLQQPTPVLPEDEDLLNNYLLKQRKP